MKYFYKFSYKFCNLFIAENNGVICNVSFNKEAVQNGFEKSETGLIKKVSVQLDEYFNGKRKTFDLPIVLNGTDFQMKIWKSLQKIPYGKTQSYGELAAAIGNPKACRAAGMANNKNPIAIIVPCHRVIGQDGNLTGYAGGLEIKKQLLELEQLI